VVDTELGHHLLKSLKVLVDHLDVEVATRDNLGDLNIQVFFLGRLGLVDLLLFLDSVGVNIGPELRFFYISISFHTAVS